MRAIGVVIGERGAEMAGLTPIDELMQFDMLIEGILPGKFLNFALGESLTNGLGFGELDPNIRKIFHLFPILHRVLFKSIQKETNQSGLFLVYVFTLKF